MHWLLLLVRFVLRTFSGDQGNGVALAARIDGRVEQRRSNLGEGSGWSLFASWRQRGHARPQKVAGRRDRTRPPGRSSGEGSPRDEV